MEDESTFEFPELFQLPPMPFDDPISLSSIDNTDPSSTQDPEPEDCNIAKIHEYLDRDLTDQESLIEKLRDFEARLDKYLQNNAG